MQPDEILWDGDGDGVPSPPPVPSRCEQTENITSRLVLRTLSVNINSTRMFPTVRLKSISLSRSFNVDKPLHHHCASVETFKSGTNQGRFDE